MDEIGRLVIKHKLRKSTNGLLNGKILEIMASFEHDLEAETEHIHGADARNAQGEGVEIKVSTVELNGKSRAGFNIPL